MADVERISVDEARRRVTEGNALLVCAYEDPARCSRIRLQGSITMRELQARLSSLPKDQPIVFYCA